jgi:hypothetical protein
MLYLTRHAIAREEGLTRSGSNSSEINVYCGEFLNWVVNNHRGGDRIIFHIDGDANGYCKCLKIAERLEPKMREHFRERLAECEKKQQGLA